MRFDQSSGQGAGGLHTDLLADDRAHRQLETVPRARHPKPGELLEGLGEVRVATELHRDLMGIGAQIENAAQAFDHLDQIRTTGEADARHELIPACRGSHLDDSLHAIERHRAAIGAEIGALHAPAVDEKLGADFFLNAPN